MNQHRRAGEALDLDHAQLEVAMIALYDLADRLEDAEEALAALEELHEPSEPPDPEPDPGPVPDPPIPPAPGPLPPDGAIIVPETADADWFRAQGVQTFWFHPPISYHILDIPRRSGSRYLSAGRVEIDPTRPSETAPNGDVIYPRSWNGLGAELQGIGRYPSSAFTGEASDVLISGLEIAEYAPSYGRRVDRNGYGVSQKAAIGNGRRLKNSIIEHVYVHDIAHGLGVEIADGSVLRDFLISHTGNMGHKGSGHLLIERGETTDCTQHAMRGFESGGCKYVNCSGVMRHVYSHDTIGPGFWVDIEGRNWTFEANWAEDCEARGFFYEISGKGTLRYNVSRNNGHAGSTGWGYRAQIVVSASDNVEVYGNATEFGETQHGIALIQQRRGTRFLDRQNVHDNDQVRTSGRGNYVGVFDDTLGIFDKPLRYPDGMHDLLELVNSSGRSYPLRVPPGWASSRDPDDLFVRTWHETDLYRRLQRDKAVIEIADNVER